MKQILNNKTQNQLKNWLFEKVSKKDKSLANLTKRKREKMQVSKIQDAKGVIIINASKPQTRDCYEKVYSKKLDNPKEIGKFLNVLLPK